MRILFVNDGIGDAGGVQNYLTAVAAALDARGHALALLHLDSVRPGVVSPLPGAPHFCVDDAGITNALAAARAWTPDVVFSHNMRNLDVEDGLVAIAPVVKMMHGYFGTCISGQKMHRAPRAVPCGRTFGVPCLALYGPRRCGVLSVRAALSGYSHASRQRELLHRYQSLVVASDHMRAEYIRHGVAVDRVVTNPLFAPALSPAPVQPDTRPFRVLFLGRMTHLKGGDLLVRAVARVSPGAAVSLIMAGDGPQRAAWEALAARLGVSSRFTGWIDAETRDALLADASIIAIPSVWPEPFGLTGLEGGAAGIPSVAFDVGGIRQWLADGTNGRLVPYDRSAVDRLAATLRELRDDRAEVARLGAGARLVASRMTVDAHTNALERILDTSDHRAAAGRV